MNKEQLSGDLKDKIVKSIVQSRLNVDMVPDDIEEEIYTIIYDYLNENKEDIFKSFKECFRGIISKCKDCNCC